MREGNAHRRLAVLLLLLAAPAFALDPRFEWETLETPHFEVHYHQGMYLYAQKIARAAERSHQRLVPLLDHTPDARTQIVVQDDTDFANGNASPLLYNLIHAYAAPPDSRSTLGDFDDAIYELVSHEYTHILHLDTVLGLPEAVNSVFGKLWITNGEQPIWFIEGLAVFAESEVSGSGRERSTQDSMMVRAQVLEGKLPRIDVLSNVPLDWPRGFGQYTVGSRFLEYIRDQYGLGALRDLSHDFGARFVPFGMNFSSDRVLGSTYIQLYDEFAQSEAVKAAAIRDSVRGAGESRIETLAHLGEWTRTPRFSPDGKTLYYTNAGPDRLPEVRALTLPPCCDAFAQVHGQVRAGDRHLATLYSDGAGDASVAVAPDGRVLYARAQVYQEFEFLQDIYAVDPATGDEQRVTRGLRGRSIDVAPDGALVFLWRKPGGRTAIAELSNGEPRTIFEDPSGEPVDSPRVSPDGRQVAFLHHRDGEWDVQLVNRDGSGVRDVTHDRALDRDPSWTADGKWLLFSSDRTGVYDIYAWSTADGVLRQVTNVVLGAFEPQPSPDGSQLALVTYSVRGYDLARMPLLPDTWRPVTSAPVADARPAPASLPPEEMYPSRPYSAIETLRPHGWLPYFSTDAYGSTIGALTAGFDAIDRHEYTATAWWSVYGKEPGWDILYTNHSLYPDISLELTRDMGTAQAAGENATGYYFERVTAGYLSAVFPFSQLERSQAVSLSYELASLSVKENPGMVATSPGRLAAVTLRYAYSDSHRFVRSISSEQGQSLSLSLRIADPALGGDFSFWQAAASASKYLQMPWLMHHDLALRGSFGISRGDLSNRHIYTLGGFQQQDPIRSVISPANAPVTILRGYVIDAFAGEQYALGTAEYRFPIWDVQAGAWTLPAYLRRIHGALFADAGDAWTPGTTPFRLHAGAGAELRAEVVLGWILPTDLRFGCARGLENSPLAILDCYAALGGVF